MKQITDPAKLKVVELRAELTARGLDTKGNKPVLVARLREALEAEGDDVPQDTSIADTTTEELDLSQAAAPSPECILPEQEISSDSVQKPPSESPETILPDDDPLASKPTTEDKKDKTEEPEEDSEMPDAQNTADDSQMDEFMDAQQSLNNTVVEETPQKEESTENVEKNNVETNEDESMQVDEKDSKEETPEPRAKKSRWGSVSEEAPKPVVESEETPSEENTESNKDETESNNTSVPPEQSARERKRKHSPSPQPQPRRRSRSPMKPDDEPEYDENAVLLSWCDSDLHLAVDKTDFCTGRPVTDISLFGLWAGARATYGVTSKKVCYEVKLVSNTKTTDIPREEKDPFLVRVGWSTLGTSHQLGECEKSYGYDGTGRKATNNVFERYGKKFREGDVVGTYLDLESDPITMSFTVNGVNQGVAFKVPKETLGDAALFPHIVTKNVQYEVNFGQREDGPWFQPLEKEEGAEELDDDDESDVEIEQPVKHVSKKHENNGIVKKDESEQKTDEDKKEEEEDKEDKEDKEEKEKNENDDEKETVEEKSEEKNEEKSEEETKEEKKEEEEVVILEKEEVEKEKEPTPPKERQKKQILGWESLGEEYIYVGKVDKEDRVPGLQRLTKREDCEVIMLCGLPSSGKTHWIQEHVAEHPDKYYTILGTSQLLDMMTVRGKTRKSSHRGGWDLLLDKVTRSVNRLLELACTRRRNYILDQTNIFPSAQRRKMRPFEGFQRRAVVIVPSEEEYSKRQAKRAHTDGKDVPDSAVLEMKANMTLPEKGDPFVEVLFPELNESEARSLVEKYNKEGRKAGYGPQYSSQKSTRNDWNDRRSNQWSRHHHSGGRGGGGGGGRWSNNQRSGGYGGGDRRHGGGGGGGWGGGGGGGGRWGGPGGGGGRNGPPMPRGGHMGGGGGGGWRSGGGGGGGSRHGGGGGGGYNRNQGGSGGGSYDRRGGSGGRGSGGGSSSGSGSGGGSRNQRGGGPMKSQSQGSNNWGQGGGQNNWGGWGNQGGWSQGGGGQGQGGWSAYGGNQWKGYGAQNSGSGGGTGGSSVSTSGSSQQNSGAQGTGGNAAAQQQWVGYPGYANWGNYYGQYAQGWGAQGQGGTGANANQQQMYNQYSQWAQYAQQAGYTGYATSTQQNSSTSGKKEEKKS